MRISRCGKSHSRDPSTLSNSCPRIVLSPLTLTIVGAHHWVIVIVKRPHDCFVNAIHALYQSSLTRYKGAPRNWDALILQNDQRRVTRGESRSVEQRIMGKDSRHASRDEISSESQRSGGLRLLELAIRGLWRLGWFGRYTVTKILLDIDTSERSGIIWGGHRSGLLQVF